jgi:folylpolyglutamate synthase
MVALIERSQTGIALAEAELGCKPSHFEVLTALAFAHFSHVKVDAMVVEAGIGGLTDATNVISTSNLALSVITTIDAEHLDALGGSIQSIAQAKAGIMKRGCANVVGQQIEEEVFGILSRHADAVGATLLNAAEEVSVLPVNVQAEVEEGAGVCQECDIVRWELPTITAEDDEEIEVADLEHWSTGAPLQRTNALHVRTASHVARGRRPTWRLQGVRLRMVGSHQRVNVAAAVRALLWLREEKKWEITDEHIRLGLQAATLPVRFQVLKASEATPGGAGLLVLDGAHTPVAARMLALTLDEVFPKHKVALVVAMARDKEHIGILQGLGTIEACEAIIFTEVKIAGSEIRAAPSAELERLAVQTLNRHNGQENLRKEVMKIKTAANMEEALRLARAQVGTVGVVCVTGSLHAAAAALSLWQVEQA